MFQDKFQQQWKIDLSLYHIKTIEGYDFSAALRQPSPVHISFLPPQEDLIDKLIVNPAVCFSMIWCCVMDQASQHYYIDEDGQKQPIRNELDFARCFDSRTMSDARMAFYEELPPFFPEMETSLNHLIKRFSTVMAMIDQEMSHEVESILSDQEIKKLVQEEVQKIRRKGA